MKNENDPSLVQDRSPRRCPWVEKCGPPPGQPGSIPATYLPLSLISKQFGLESALAANLGNNNEIGMCDLGSWTMDHIDTKAKCRHPKNLTCKGTSRQVFLRIYGLEMQSVMLVY